MIEIGSCFLDSYFLTAREKEIQEDCKICGTVLAVAQRTSFLYEYTYGATLHCVLPEK